MEAQNKERTIDTLLGANNILAVLPHAQKKLPDEASPPMTILGRELAKQLGCYAVINGKYRPELVDMNDVRAIRKRKKVAKDFLIRIREFKEEITENDLLPLVLVLNEGASGDGQQSDILIGYGQGERNHPERPHRPTMSPSQLAKIRVSLEDQGFSTDLAPTDSSLCGREEYCLNQLFRQKDFLDSFYDPAVRSLVLTLAADRVQNCDRARETARALTAALQPFAETISLVRKVAVDAIEVEKPQDLRYIFRVHGDDQYTDMVRESYIEELARSIAKNGLLHPLVLLQKKDGRYKILCGFRRFQAIRRLGWQWIEAKTYSEEAFTTEDFFNISLAENTKRRNLNPIEIGNFLESAAEELGLNNTILAERFGESLGIGKPGAKVSQSTIHKYRKLYQIRKRGESPEMIVDVINDRLQFAIAAEILAPIQDARDRDSLYLEVIKPLAPTRPQLVQIVKLLGKIDRRLSQAIATPFVSKALSKAAGARQRANSFIAALQRKTEKKEQDREEKIAATVSELRQNFFGKKAGKLDFNITRSKRGKKTALTMHVRLQQDSMEETIDKLQQLLADKKEIKKLTTLLE